MDLHGSVQYDSSTMRLPRSVGGRPMHPIGREALSRMPAGTRFYRWTDTELVLCEKRLTSTNPDGFYFVATVGNLKTGGPQGWGGLQFDATGSGAGRPVRYFLPVAEAARTPAPAASEPARASEPAAADA